MGYTAIKRIRDTVSARVSQIIVGKEQVTDLAVITLLCGGHMLLDDVPGTGKTVLAKTFASALSLEFKRVQCVPDMLPSDLMGVNYFDMKSSEFRFIKGPVFTNVLLADEINRAMPKTQSGLLECMEERQITIDGEYDVIGYYHSWKGKGAITARLRHVDGDTLIFAFGGDSNVQGRVIGGSYAQLSVGTIAAEILARNVTNSAVDAHLL